jgi:ATP-dependent exoDNAse (exonuclease V) alpha subunit
MTVHKAQGLTVDHALLYGSQALTREAGYDGLSRGRRENHIYATTTELSARTGECDFAQRDPLNRSEEPIADLTRRLHTSRAHQLASNQLRETPSIEPHGPHPRLVVVRAREEPQAGRR